MKTLVTQGIKVTVRTTFEGTFFKNYKMHFAFGYTISIENLSKDVVQLTDRHWDIYDALKDPETIEGKGVIGKQPIIQPGASHTYSSGCLLASPLGSMRGYYTMWNATKKESFDVEVPLFNLAAPFVQN